METSEITYKQPPQLFDDTQKVIAQLESKLNAPYCVIGMPQGEAYVPSQPEKFLTYYY